MTSSTVDHRATGRGRRTVLTRSSYLRGIESVSESSYRYLTMTSPTADHRATGRGRTHLRCIESSHNDIINNRSQSYRKR